ncbi:MAG: MFS transporter [Nanoarchaeota archaeon]|nr:MFS transporter [Nanoarchaeota archaeon]
MQKKGEKKGIKLLTLATSVRWLGWGFGEAFIPVFLLLFSKNFLEAGILASAYYLLFFLSLPISSYIADRYNVKKMLLTAMIIYIFIGLGYFVAGITGAVIFIILSRSLSGVSFSMDQIGKESYIMRHSPKGKVSETFGRFDFVTNLWWVVAVLVGLILVEFADVKIHELLLLVVPTSLISFFILMKLKEKSNKKKNNFSIKNAYLETFKEIKKFSKGLKLVAFLTFVFALSSSILYFFVPISAYLGGNGVVSSAVLAFVYSIPFFFGNSLGKIVDKKKDKVYIFGGVSLILVFLAVAFFKSYAVLLVIMLISSGIFELLSLTRRGMTAKLGNRMKLGEIDGALNGVAALGAITGPILFGFFMDSLGMETSYLIISGIILISISVFILKRKHLN